MESPVDLNLVYGAIYIGIMIATFFQGVLTLQAYVYYESFPKDPFKIKLLVALAWIVDFIHLVFIGKIGYTDFVTNWGDVASLSAPQPWGLDAHLIPTGIATLLCQAFFLWRGRNILLVVLLSIICLMPFALDILICIQSVRINFLNPIGLLGPRSIGLIARSNASGFTLKPYATSLFALGATSDVILAVFLCYYLHRGKGDYQITNSVVSRLMRYTVTTGLTTAALAVACLIAFRTAGDAFLFGKDVYKFARSRA
ncbi:hypothetical protein M422DRAFT_783500 [Sphaerobolus stellatus SS14]|uniref:DUF6534 domain-containing protein n=1 Tax=Sphaerobolus stellatus (strain SS14) TaxID=990650 RepID=A0A0C9V4J3_SPHS4|nr:hypothetical protein M422DRAFT_783500 [Sphaerobolus stellatus SS14]